MGIAGEGERREEREREEKQNKQADRNRHGVLDSKKY